MYRTIYPEAPGLHHSWYNKGRKRALERCQCMQLQYRHHLGWFKKIVGFFVVIISLVVLFWNEGRAIEGTKAYDEGLRSVYPLVTPDYVLKENEGKLVHIVGYLRIPEPLEDDFYGVSISAVKLKRRVQMYQWVEEEIKQEI
ncbi:unnamed protein product [Orchesella dallaii]|uniref:Transmembrane protein n=1 Tax=Orchesella dallaii TaxID=48710 RepID=A0ABP1QZ44_9HEXA